MFTPSIRSRALFHKSNTKQSDSFPLERVTSPSAPMAEIAARGLAHWPTDIALRSGAQTLTFAELQRRSELVAHLLIRLGVRAGDRVVVFGQKDFDTVIAVLAITMIRAAYVPLDPRLPRQRIQMLLEDAQPVLVLGSSEFHTLAHARSYFDTTGIAMRILPDFRAGQELPKVKPSDAAYLMYTSGSTGRPKGVVVEHSQVQAFFESYNAHAQLASGHCCMNTGAFHFDVSILDVFLPLYVGASVVLTPELPQRNLLLATLAQYRVTHFYAAGTILGLMTGDGSPLDRYDLSSLQLLQTGAEVCNPQAVNEWLARCPALRFINSYGPTEATVGCVCFSRSPSGLLPLTDVPIGTAHRDTVALVINAQNQVTNTPFEEGELWLGGPQVMRGYWNRTLEAEASTAIVDGQRFYKTGDRVHRDDAGLLHYRGRKDSQVKIDGCRIDLAEVRCALLEHPCVLCAEVGTVLNAQERLRVAAALVLREPIDISLIEYILAELRRKLPGVAIPIALLCCDELPRTSSGKTDTKACMSMLQPQIGHGAGRAFTLRAGKLQAISPHTSNSP